MRRHVLQRWFRATGVLQRELALRAGTQQPRISRFLHGTCGLSYALACRIVAATREMSRGRRPKPPVVRVEDLLDHRPRSRRKRSPEPEVSP